MAVEEAEVGVGRAAGLGGWECLFVAGRGNVDEAAFDVWDAVLGVLFAVMVEYDDVVEVEAFGSVDGG